MASTTTDRRQGVNSNAAIKVAVVAATTANITLSGEQTIDGIAIVDGNRVLVWQQTTGLQNGIYRASTGAWTRDYDFDGTYDVKKGTLVRVNSGSMSGGGWFAVSTSDPITIGTTSIAFERQNINNVTHSKINATAGQTLVTAPTYQIGANSIAVFVNGLRKIVDEDYTETSTGSITFLVALSLNDEVDMYAGLSVGNLTAALASAVSITDSGDFYVGTTVESVLQEIRDAITVDNGDASATLTYNSSTPVQRWNTPLTVNRTVTLSTTNAKEGAHFVIARGSGATGASTLAVGSLVTLRAPGEWCEVRYDAGTAAYVLEKYGTLPSAEALGMTADNGDTSQTLTVGTSLRIQRWATALTAERTATLATTGAWTGARFRIERAVTFAAATNLGLAVLVGTSVLVRLYVGQWCEVEYNGTTWVLVATGDARQRNTSKVEIFDDFLGEEVNAFWWQPMIGTDASCQQVTMRADQRRGVCRLTTGADAGATMALNGSQMSSRLNWQPSRSGFYCEFRLTIDAITNVALFVGMTDQTATLEMPFTLGAGDVLTSNATDAFGVLFDTGADTDNWWLVGVAADVDATKQNSAVAPVAATFETWAIEVDSAGIATFYRNGTLVGTAMSGAVTNSTLLTPVVAAFSRGAAARNIDVDLIHVEMQR